MGGGRSKNIISMIWYLFLKENAASHKSPPDYPEAITAKKTMPHKNLIL